MNHHGISNIDNLWLVYQCPFYLDISADTFEHETDEIASALQAKYNHPDWQAMLMYPWLQSEETFRLSEVYTILELTSVSPRRTLRDYLELFEDVGNREESDFKIGIRILIKGDPGIGKTTFSHKVALDWAGGHLGKFHLVLVVKLRELTPGQSIVSVISTQMNKSECTVDEKALNTLLSQGEKKVLLILDGLDEIDLQKYPKVSRILSSEDYPRCCVMATSRPHFEPWITGYMTYIAKINGFSLKSAEEYVSHIIHDEEVKKQFFKLLTERTMHEMYKIPIILQALALLFKGNNRLPDTYTTTYNRLIYFLQKTCETSQGLSAGRIRKAINLVNELAFRGLTQEIQRLVFSREDITNDDIFKLGILSGAKTVTGFDLTSTVQFPHKTVQEYSTAGHVTKELKAGKRQPWERIKEMFIKCFTDTEFRDSSRCRTQFLQPHNSNDAEKNKKSLTLSQAAQTFERIFLRGKDGKEAAIKGLFKFILDQGFFDEEQDIPNMWQAVKSFPPTQHFTHEELKTCFDLHVKLMSKASCDQKSRMRERARKLIHSRADVKNLAVVLGWICKITALNPTGTLDFLESLGQKFLSSGELFAFQLVNTPARDYKRQPTT